MLYLFLSCLCCTSNPPLHTETYTNYGHLFLRMIGLLIIHTNPQCPTEPSLKNIKMDIIPHHPTMLSIYLILMPNICTLLHLSTFLCLLSKWFCHTNNSNQVYTHPSESISLIMSASSASVGFCPKDLITVPNSLVVIVPSPSLSKRLKASLNSAICSSVSWSAMVHYKLYHRSKGQRIS